MQKKFDLRDIDIARRIKDLDSLKKFVLSIFDKLSKGKNQTNPARIFYLKKQVLSQTSLTGVFLILYNTHLSGEGLAVLDGWYQKTMPGWRYK